MTQREKVLLGRIYDVINHLGGLRARNPADIKTISNYHRAIPQIMYPLQMAVSSLGFGDFSECGEMLDEAEAELKSALLT